MRYILHRNNFYIILYVGIRTCNRPNHRTTRTFRNYITLIFIFRPGDCKENNWCINAFIQRTHLYNLYDTNILLVNYFWYVLIDMATEYYLTQIFWWFCPTIQGRIQPYHANKKLINTIQYWEFFNIYNELKWMLNHQIYPRA